MFSSHDDARALFSKWRSNESIIKCVLGVGAVIRSSFTGKITELSDTAVQVVGENKSEGLLIFPLATFEYADNREAPPEIRDFADETIECVLTAKFATPSGDVVFLFAELKKQK